MFTTHSKPQLRRLSTAVARRGRPCSKPTVEVLENRTLLTFNAPINYPTELGGGPQAAVVGDLRGDGKLDIVVTDNNRSDVSVLLGNGDGTFQPAVHYPAGPNPFAVALGDFNGDHKLDIVVTNAGFSTEGHTVSVLLGNGDGTFQSPRTFLVGRNPTSVAVGDFNGNGKLDLVTANITNEVSLLPGNGDGTFQTDHGFLLGRNPTGVAVGDFNGDGFPDLVLTQSTSNTVVVFLNAADGRSAPGESRTAKEFQPEVAAVAALFTDVRGQRVNQTVGDRQPGVAAVDSASAGGRSEVVSIPNEKKRVDVRILDSGARVASESRESRTPTLWAFCPCTLENHEGVSAVRLAGEFLRARAVFHR